MYLSTVICTLPPMPPSASRRTPAGNDGMTVRLIGHIQASKVSRTASHLAAAYRGIQGSSTRAAALDLGHA